MMRKVEIPERMRHLKCDERGYPIPCMVLIDSTGRPHFAINDDAKRLEVIRKELCSICGTKLFRGRWFVGGALSAFHPQGAFIDPPMHAECCRFALQVCPYLAAPRYSAEIGIAKAKAYASALTDNRLLVDNTQMPGRPLNDMFIALMTTRPIAIYENFNLKPTPPYNIVEYWRRGERLPDREGSALVQEALERFDEHVSA
jgi:hypothetical protein